MKRRFVAAILITAAVTAAVLGVRVSANEDLTKRNGTYYSSNGAEIPDVKARGIDISTHQGDIDWNALKNQSSPVSFQKIL